MSPAVPPSTRSSIRFGEDKNRTAMPTLADLHPNSACIRRLRRRPLSFIYSVPVRWTGVKRLSLLPNRPKRGIIPQIWFSTERIRKAFLNSLCPKFSRHLDSSLSYVNVRAPHTHCTDDYHNVHAIYMCHCNVRSEP